jgi:CRISPR-associated endonuclease/helicase Cas3
MTKERTTWTKNKRMNEVLRLLRDKDRTIEELCKRIYSEHTPINHRKILRDIEDLKLEGHVIDPPTPERQPKYHLVSSPARAMQPAEALAAHVALRLLYHHTPNPPNSYLDALEKIANSMPEDLRNIAGHSLRLAKNTDKKFGNFEPIANCWTRRHAIAFDYLAMTTSSNTPHRVELEVYFVEASRSNFELYVIGRRRNHEPFEVRTYMMRLMKNVTPLKDQYQIPDDFDPQKYLSNAWGVIGDRNPVIVRLEFDKSVKRWLERDFPGVQKREETENGNLILTIQTGANNDGKPVELMSWIRGWGANVEILEPQSLKDEWLNDARELLRLHGSEQP